MNPDIANDPRFPKFIEEMERLPRVLIRMVPMFKTETPDKPVPPEEDDTLYVSPEGAWAFAALLQLALRHPEVAGVTVEKAKVFLSWFREVCLPPGSAMVEIFDEGMPPQ